MKDQASLNLLIVDSPIDSKALTGHLMLRATSTGLKVYDVNGSEQELGGGGEIDWSNVSASTINLSTTTGELKLMGASSMTLELPASNSKIHFEGASLNLFATDLNFNGSALNTAEGLVQLDESGRLPAVDGSQLTNLPAATVDLTNYSTSTIHLTSTDGDVKFTTGNGYGSIQLTVTDDANPERATFKTPGVWDIRLDSYLTKISGTQQMDIEANGSACPVKITAGSNGGDIELEASGTLKYNGANLNAANGLVQLGSDGKIPSSILPESAVDLSNYSAATIKLSSTSTFTASGAMTTDIGSTTGVTNIIGNTVRLHGTYGTTVGEAGELNLGGSSKNSLQPATQITVNVTDPANKLLLNNAKPNAANGFALVGSDGKLPASILPESSGGSVDLSSYVGGIGLTSSDDVPVVIAFNSGNPTYNANLTMNAAGVTLAGYGDVSLEHTGGAYLRLSSGEVDLSSEGSLLLQSTSRLVINATEGVFLGAAGLNTAGGLVKVGEDGKIPSSLYEAGSAGATPQLMFTVPSNASGLHLEITAGKLADGTDNAALINTATSADHRTKVLGNSGGTDWITCPDTGFGTNFAGWPVKVDVTGLLDPSEISYIRYRWVPTTGDPSDWYAMVYPCATEAPIPSSGGSGGDTTELDNRVTALESTVGSLDAAVDEILADYGEGSGALVYRVVASATEPENPTEGMIWIQTA